MKLRQDPRQLPLPSLQQVVFSPFLPPFFTIYSTRARPHGDLNSHPTPSVVAINDPLHHLLPNLIEDFLHPLSVHPLRPETLTPSSRNADIIFVGNIVLLLKIRQTAIEGPPFVDPTSRQDRSMDRNRPMVDSCPSKGWGFSLASGEGMHYMLAANLTPTRLTNQAHSSFQSTL